VIHLWDLNQQHEVGRLKGHTGSITALVFDPASERLISGGFDTTVRLWNLTNRDVQRVTQR
ncbi:MAG: hypothetical protein JW959_14475, partial [Pirellulales bacterium]|nr:hypothetical protein [Pirellulales bacterium]